jgi:outer membrane lipoprotein-sorting protein
MPPVRGSLIADGLGRFRLEHGEGVVVSDGETLWQYSEATRQVVIRDAAHAGRAGNVLLRFLNARPMAASRTGDGILRVVVDPESVGESLDSLVITLSGDGKTVRSVETEDPAGNRVEYRVLSLRHDALLAEGTFRFTAPRGAETVDMR